jgi:hypothetical protein
MADFPITINSQEEFDAQIEGRIQRLRTQWERENNIPTIERERDEARNRASKAERDGLDRLVRRDARDVLSSMNVRDPNVQKTVMRLADFSGVQAGDDGEPSRKAITDAIKAVHKDTPAIFGDDAKVTDAAPDADQGGDDQGGAPLTREKIDAMSPAEINGAWDRITAFLSGERR